VHPRRADRHGGPSAGGFVGRAESAAGKCLCALPSTWDSTNSRDVVMASDNARFLAQSVEGPRQPPRSGGRRVGHLPDHLVTLGGVRAPPPWRSLMASGTTNRMLGLQHPPWLPRPHSSAGPTHAVPTPWSWAVALRHRRGATRPACRRPARAAGLPPQERRRRSAPRPTSAARCCTDGAADALLTAARTEGLVLDPVFSGRALAGLVAEVGDGSIRAGETVVLLASGGLPGFFGHPAAVALGGSRV
jgi:hypothetical protein